ncbi:MAG: zinc ribbon domain-containing protein [Thermoplasmata archaeon]|nr:zinc ribbon domain-containing protein [Thermoplasmata archaeon]
MRYAAIFLGVSFTALGGVLLFWGLLWQAHAILLAERGASAPQGGGCFIPSGVIILTLGILWLKASLKPPKKRGAKEKVRCPSCGRMVDSDLPFCYWCGAPLKEEGKEGEEKNIRRGGY